MGENNGESQGNLSVQKCGNHAYVSILVETSAMAHIQLMGQ